MLCYIEAHTSTSVLTHDLRLSQWPWTWSTAAPECTKLAYTDARLMRLMGTGLYQVSSGEAVSTCWPVFGRWIGVYDRTLAGPPG